jgi:hydrogenase expression/formation protein HypD
MRHLSEYRDASLLRGLVARLQGATHRPYRIMEVCGGQTNTIVRYGLDQCLAPQVTLLHGPGCPVCVTPASYLDAARQLAMRPEVVLCSFGDMLRVPGSEGTLLDCKSAGADVRTLYSPLDALRLARSLPDKQVVFFSIGFETTAPLTALAVLQAAEANLPNFSVLCAHVTIPPAIFVILQSAEVQIDALLAPGHVCTVTGTQEYERLSLEFGVPIVVTGFEPADILQGVWSAVRCLEDARAGVIMQYSRAVTPEGNLQAQRLIQRVLTVTDREWRGLGVIPSSGLDLSPQFAGYDACRRFALRLESDSEPGGYCARVLQGNVAPCDCPKFLRECTAEHPLGAPMVSSEGACAAYMQYSRSRQPSGDLGGA